MDNKKYAKEFCFSKPFLKVEYVKNYQDFKILEECIIVNLSDNILRLENESLERFESGVFCNLDVEKIDEALVIVMKNKIFSYAPYANAQKLMDEWTHVYDVFPYDNLKEVKLWRSPKERIGNVEFNLWFAPEKTHCAIHNEHNFSEIHTQVYGVGYMQKFHSNSYKSLYQTIGMLPGTSHKKFCNDKLEYPWHQYLSETDCIWLVMEEFPES